MNGCTGSFRNEPAEIAESRASSDRLEHTGRPARTSTIIDAMGREGSSGVIVASTLLATA